MAKLVKKTGEKPEIMTIKWNDGNTPIYASINNNISENEDGTYSWDALELPEHTLVNIHNADIEMKRKVLIIHILRAYYDDNDATAILSNYLNEPENEKYKSEFEQLQKCRFLAKKLAKTIIEENIY
jgi:hypothetical protein